MKAEAVVFCRRSGANGLGHIGWGFNLPNGMWVVGSMENPSGQPFEPTGWTGFWYKEVANAHVAMRGPAAFGAPPGTPPYDEAKELDVPVANVGAANAMIQSWAMRGFNVSSGNCMGCAFDILHAFGAAMPDPSSWNNLIPINWFNTIQGPPLPV